jgi:hypothetical protein
MTPELTREQREAIDERQGQPVYIVDSDRHETFVLLTSSDFEKVRPMLANPTSNGAWTDDKNRRRVELIDKKIAGTITAMESVELTDLQRQAESHFDQVAPPPMKGLAELHQQLTHRESQ